MGSIETERVAYERTALMKNVSAYKGVDFLLVHGTGDGSLIPPPLL